MLSEHVSKENEYPNACHCQYLKKNVEIKLGNFFLGPHSATTTSLISNHITKFTSHPHLFIGIRVSPVRFEKRQSS